MENIKPEFSEYLKSQNRMPYKLTGIMEDKTGISFAEKNYTKSKCIIDFVILVVYMTVMFIGFSLLLNICVSVYNLRLNHTGYDSIDTWKLVFICIGLYAVLYLLHAFITPLLMKALRILLGLRWYFVKFERTGMPDKEGSNMPNIITYLEFYNNRIAYESDRISLRGSKSEDALKSEYFKRYGIARVGKLIEFFYHLLFFALYFSYVFIIFDEFGKISDLTTLITLYYAAAIVLYLLSHMAAYLRWKNYCRRRSHLEGYREPDK